MKYRLQITDDDGAELIRVRDDVTVWRADDDDKFWDSDDERETDADEIITYLVRKGVVASCNDVNEVIDESGEYPSLDNDGAFDDGDDDDELSELELETDDD